MKRILILSCCLLSIGLFTKCESDSDASALISNGQGGSLARFAIQGDYLYVVDNKDLTTFSITDGQLEVTSINELRFGVETIFPYQGNLFIGSIDAMYIFSLDNPSIPVFEGEFSHTVSCDPVVVQGDYAYVSLRLFGCNQAVIDDVVEILDVSNINNPVLISSFFEVETPYGLGIKDDVLYLCQNKNGLRLIDVSDKTNPTLITTLPIQSYDVIINNSSNSMIVVGDDGLAQYNITDPRNPERLSLIPTE